jgi:anaerobic magnesium-protoporphyrin IX monomethyl ester cyclase
MRILLLNPPPVDGARIIREGRCMQRADSWATPWPPLSLSILAALARRAGAEVELWDGNVEPGASEASALRSLRRFQPELVVFAPAFPTLGTDAAFAQALAQARPGLRVLGFGGLFTLLEEQAMQACPAVDWGIVGEPEQSFEELVSALLAGESPEGLPGLMWREGAEVRKGPPRPLLQDLDSLPFAARDLLRHGRYRLPHNGRRYSLVNIARGCPFPCTTCIATIYYGREFRRHSVDYLLRELTRCVREHGLRDFLFWEEIFTLHRDFVLELCEGILAADLRISWAATSRADHLDLELLRTMRRAGCTLLGLGIESASQQLLDAMGKRTRLEDVRRGVRLCRQAGVKSMGHFVLGLPGETPATLDETVRSVTGLGLDYIQAYPLVPYPKTSVGELAREQGWITARRWEDYDLGGACILETPQLPAAEVDRARQRMYRRFYLRPHYVARQVGSLARHPRQLLQASRFLRWIGTGR